MDRQLSPAFYGTLPLLGHWLKKEWKVSLNFLRDFRFQHSLVPVIGPWVDCPGWIIVGVAPLALALPLPVSPQGSLSLSISFSLSLPLLSHFLF